MNSGHLCSKISLAKQWPHGVKFCCSVGGICFQRWKKHQRTFIISVSAKLIDDPLTKIRGDLMMRRMAYPYRKLDIVLAKVFGRGQMYNILLQRLKKVCPCYDGQIPSKVIEQNNFRILRSNPCKWSCCWITESIVRFLQRWHGKGFASISGPMEIHIPIFPPPLC